MPRSALNAKGIVADRDAPVSQLDMPIYISQMLSCAGIKTVRDLEFVTEEEVIALDGFDTKALEHLKSGLARDGYRLGEPPGEDASCYRFIDPWNPK